MKELELLKSLLIIEKGSWVENHNYWQTLSLTYGATHPKSQRQHKQVEEIKVSMHKLEEQIKNFETIRYN